MRGLKNRAVVAASLLFAQPAIAGVDYVVDAGNSSVSFSVRHLVINKVRGSFGSFRGVVIMDELTEQVTSISGEIDTGTISTNNAQRDEHLRSPDFFDVEQYPSISFESNEVKRDGDGYLAVGTLTVRDVKREVDMRFTVVGTVTDPWGNTRIGIEGSLAINRHDYGISWSQKLDSGGLVVGDQVSIDINVEAVMR